MAQPKTPPGPGPPPPLPSQGEDLPAKRWGEAGSLKPSKPEQPFFYGGQAPIESVMMRGQHPHPTAGRLPPPEEIRGDNGALKTPSFANPPLEPPLLARPRL